jgi:hypothetical protein
MRRLLNVNAADQRDWIRGPGVKYPFPLQPRLLSCSPRLPDSSPPPRVQRRLQMSSDESDYRNSLLFPPQASYDLLIVDITAEIQESNSSKHPRCAKLPDRLEYKPKLDGK